MKYLEVYEKVTDVLVYRREVTESKINNVASDLSLELNLRFGNDRYRVLSNDSNEDLEIVDLIFGGLDQVLSMLRGYDETADINQRERIRLCSEIITEANSLINLSLAIMEETLLCDQATPEISNIEDIAP